MLSYRHGFHAGNHADVLKHAVQALALSALLRKPRALCYVDTHAGAGRYALDSAMARKLGEHRDGIARLWTRSDVPACLEPYLAAVRAVNPAAILRWYPGSPWIARHLLRAQDRLVLGELHPQDHAELAAGFVRVRGVSVVRTEAAATLKAQLPPAEQRGLVLVDPAYELRSDYAATAALLDSGCRRWPGGVFAVWYPLLAGGGAARLRRAVVAAGTRKVLRAELLLQPDDGSPGLKGSGMLLVNPPFGLDGVLADLLPWLGRVLRAGPPATWTVEWLVPE